MRRPRVMAAMLLVAGCGGSGDAGPAVDAAAADAITLDAAEAACPNSADGCNLVVGTLGGESFVVTSACPGFGAVVQSAWLSSYPVDAGCTPTMPPQPTDRVLDVAFQWLGADPPIFSTGTWYPTGPSGAGVEATSGTAVLDVWEVNSLMRGTFDLTFGRDRVCGCFDAVTP